MRCGFEIPKDALHSSPMSDSRMMHKLTDFVNNEGEVRLSEHNILKSSNSTPVESEIMKWITIKKFKSMYLIISSFSYNLMYLHFQSIKQLTK